MTGYKTKVDLIYEILLKKISRGDFQDGERLVISQISKENSVSDIPVREAIRRLESEGYVNVIANQGAVVRCFTKEKLMEIFQIKAVLEGYATRLSIDYLTVKDIEDLKKRNEKLRHALETGDFKQYSQLNVDFHLRIYQNLPQQELFAMIQGLWKKYSVTKSVFSIAPKRMNSSFEEHEEIIRLIVKKEYDAVEQFVRRHKMKSVLDMVEEMEHREKQV